MKLLLSLEGLIFLISCFMLPPLWTWEHPSSANHMASFQNGAVLLAKFKIMNWWLDCSNSLYFQQIFQRRNSREVHKKTHNRQNLWKMLRAKSSSLQTSMPCNEFFLNGYKIEEPDRFMGKRENVGLKYCIFCAVIVLNFLENCLLIT